VVSFDTNGHKENKTKDLYQNDWQSKDIKKKCK